MSIMIKLNLNPNSKLNLNPNRKTRRKTELPTSALASVTPGSRGIPGIT